MSPLGQVIAKPNLSNKIVSVLYEYCPLDGDTPKTIICALFIFAKMTQIRF